MAAKETLRKGLWLVLTTGATLSIGFLSFAGMFVLSSSLFWCGAAFVLAAAYESQVNGEGISRALLRMFDPNHLSIALVQNYLKDLLKTHDDNNSFLKNYRAQKRYAQELDEYIDALEEQLEVLEKKHRISRFLNLTSFAMNSEEIEASVKVQEIKKTIAIYKEQLDTEKNCLRTMELTFLRQLNIKKNNNPSDFELDIRKLFSRQNQEELLQEINKKTWLIRLSWIFALGSGISSGLATISAMQAGIVTFTILSAIPGGIVITAAVLAAAGYTLLMYQNISDMIQEYNSKWKNYFDERKNESDPKRALRIVGTVLAIGLGIFATIATAGTWWYAVKNGAAILGAAEKAAVALQGVSVSLMTLPVFIFNSRNSVKSIDKISKSNYGQLVENTKKNIANHWEEESIAQFFNPIRFIEKLISYSAQSVLFVGHVISMGMISDRLPGVPAKASIPAIASVEIAADSNYMAKNKNTPNANPAEDEEDEHTHESKVLTLLFAPVTLVVGVLKFFAAGWDWAFSPSRRNFGNSLKKMFSVEEPEKPISKQNPLHPQPVAENKDQPVTANKPTPPKMANLTHAWRRQHVIEVCDQTIERLQDNSPTKVIAAQKIREMALKNDSDKDTLIAKSAPLAKHRNTIWQEAQTRSQREMNAALMGYKPEEIELKAFGLG